MEKEVKYIRCKRCNRPLKTEQTKALGYGPICYKKFQEDLSFKKVDLFSKNITK